MEELPGEGLKRPGPPIIKMDATVKVKASARFGNAGDKF